MVFPQFFNSNTDLVYFVTSGRSCLGISIHELGNNQENVLPFPITEDNQFYLLVDRGSGNKPGQLISFIDGFAVIFKNDIAASEAGLFRRGILFNVGDQGTLVAIKTK